MNDSKWDFLTGWVAGWICALVIIAGLMHVFGEHIRP